MKVKLITRFDDLRVLNESRIFIFLVFFFQFTTLLYTHAILTHVWNNLNWDVTLFVELANLVILRVKLILL